MKTKASKIINLAGVETQMRRLLKRYTDGEKLTASEHGKIGAWARKQNGYVQPKKQALQKLLESKNVRLVRATIEVEFIECPEDDK